MQGCAIAINHVSPVCAYGKGEDMNRFCYASVAFISLMTATASAAATTVYGSLSDFEASTSGITTNGFNNVALNSSTYLFENGATEYIQPGFAISQSTRNAFNSNGDTNPSTSYYYNWGTGGVIHSPYLGTISTTFSNPVTAFALDLGVFFGAPFPYPPGTIPGAATTLYGQPLQIATSQGNFVVNPATTQNLTFFGVTSDTPFTSFTISGLSNQAGASLVFDNLRFGTSTIQSAVPEPATWAMMLLGFGFIGAAMRSSKRRQKLTLSYA